jgi:DNA-binding NarL/FixJ family response regulator
LGKLLIAEDDLDVSRSLDRFFAHHLETLVADTIARATLLLSTGPKLRGAVIDISLPDGSGLTILEDVRARFPRAPVLVLTARFDPATINAVQERGAEYAVKPARRANLDAFLVRLQAHGCPSRGVGDAIAAFATEHGLAASEASLLAAAASGTLRIDLADKLGVSENTVKKRVRSILDKCPGTEGIDEVVSRVWDRAKQFPPLHPGGGLLSIENMFDPVP